MEFRGKVVLVTGGSGGIGRVIAAHFAKEGAVVVIVGRKPAALKSALRFIGANARAIAGDVSRPADPARIIKKVIAAYRRIDVLVNCAGVQEPIGPFRENDLAKWKKNIEVNLLGTVAMTKAVLPHMLKKKYGKIINFSGGGATGMRPNFSAYAVSKIGIVKFTEILAEELKDSHIDANAVAPGAVNTAMLREVLRAGKRAGEKEFGDARKRKAMGGTPPETPAELVLYLASKKSDGLSGRLISAPWDEWRKWNKEDIEKIMAGERFTLRRVV